VLQSVTRPISGPCNLTQVITGSLVTVTCGARGGHSAVLRAMHGPTRCLASVRPYGESTRIGVEIANMDWKFHRKIYILLLLTCFATAASAQSAAPASSQKPAEEAKSAATPVAATSADQEYHIGPQDLLQIDVWKEPEITRSVPVRPDGKISLPLLNDVQAAGLTSMQLAANIRDGLSKYLTNPQVTVIVSQINSQRVFVNGEVSKAGAQPLLPGMTVLQALSSAGGFTQFAKTKSIYILRNKNGKQEKVPYNYKDVVKGKLEDTALLPGDVIVVP
jgi:polysaccharide biosynthesis/export protein